MKVTYNIPGTLEEVLDVVTELNAISGMDPEEIITEDHRRIRFNKKDYRELMRSNINPEIYITKNLIS